MNVNKQMNINKLLNIILKIGKQHLAFKYFLIVSKSFQGFLSTLNADKAIDFSV